MAVTKTRETNLIKSINPATLEVVKEIPTTPAAEVQNIVSNACDAQKLWGGTRLSARLRYFDKINEYIISNMDSIAETITIDNGKTRLEAINAEIVPVLDMIRFCNKEASKALSAERLSHPLFGIMGIRSSLVYEPLGVVAIIAPWNFPFSIPVTQILMALATGNTVIFKPAALTASVGELTREIFEQAGLPDGVVNVVQGSGSVIGEAIMESGVNRVAFTGSVPVGRHLMKRAGETLTPITLELGGKDPFIVLEDADIERASSGAVWGAFINAGQVCASVERVYIHKNVASRFIDLVVEKTKRLRVGNGLDFTTDMGPLIDENQVRTVEAHVAEAIKKGARVLAGGRRPESLKGTFYEPTVLVDVDHTMVCMMEETFGPTMPIMLFSDIDEAVKLANDSRFALTASVWSANERKAEDICRRIVTGSATVNDCEYTYGFAVCPWGGPKESGIGRTHSVHGLHEFTSMKNVSVTTPRMKYNLWWHPYTESRYNQVKLFAKGMYGTGLASKCSLVSDTVKAIASK